ncbi:MAG: SDR family NAD(P)-dependent oxidoreductase, partial [Rhodanobacteraceae bacterium]
MTGKVAIITGASRGIGARVAHMLAADGASVVVNYKKNADLAEQVVAGLREAGGDGIAVQGDVENAEEIVRIFDAAADTYGRVDYYINNAAASAFKRIMDLKAHHLDRSYALNVRA